MWAQCYLLITLTPRQSFKRLPAKLACAPLEVFSGHALYLFIPVNYIVPKTRLLFVVLVTGALTLKRRFLGENFGSANSRFKIYNSFSNFLQHFELLEVSTGDFPFSTNYHHKREIFSTLLVSAETPSTKQLATITVGHFCYQNSQFSDQSDKRKFQSAFSLSALPNSLIYTLFVTRL